MALIVVTVSVCVLLVLITTGIHLGTMQGMVRRAPGWLKRHKLRIPALVLAAIGAHLLEIVVFAAGLSWLDQIKDMGTLVSDSPIGFHDYVYYSAVTFSTLGFGDIVPTGHLRLVTMTESLTGLVLVAWTASALFLVMQHDWTRRSQSEQDSDQSRANQ